MTYLIARMKRKPFVLWTGIWMRVQTPVQRLALPLTRYFYRHADAIVVYGAHIKHYLICEGVAPERIFIADHAVDNSVYNRPVAPAELCSLRRELAIGEAQKVVLYLGRLDPGKGLDYLVEAFAQVQDPSTVLVLAGAGSERERLEALVEQKGIRPRVRFAGYVPAAKTVKYYALAWVYVLPSVTTNTFKEPWGLVVNEAFNQGTPVIATDAVGAAAGGLVEHGVNGLIVPERNAVTLADALNLITGSPSVRNFLGRNAASKIARWDNERMVAGFRAALQFATAQQVAPVKTGQ
jgi:glycosyltransferase involved in cell wall biosynthesis